MTPVASERSIFSKNHDYNNYYKKVFCVTVYTYVLIFRDLDARGGKKNYGQTHTHRRRTTTVTTIIKIIRSAEAHTYNIILYLCKTAHH